jgi:hypothetical protein
MVMASCNILDPFNDDRDELNDARRRWARQGIASYQYRLTQLCFCPSEIVRPFAIRVSNGIIAEVRDAETGEAPPSYYDPRTIPELFEVIDQALDRHADSIDVEYDPQLGYPTRIMIDYERNTADEELGFRVEALLRLD